jgi:four helix bundle protein
MKTENLIQTKTFAFAIRIVNTSKYLKHEQNEFILSKQMLRSGTSIGANVEEGIGSQSKADFISKFSIAYKVARETSYWLRLLCATNYLSKEMSDSLIYDAEEICRIIGKIQISSKRNL